MDGRRTRRLRGLTAAGLALLCACSCADRAERPRRAASWTDTEAAVPASASYVRESEAFRWDLGAAAEADRWRPLAADLVLRRQPGWLAVVASTTTPAVARRVDLDAAGVQAIRLLHGGLDATRDAVVTLSWQREGDADAVAPERRLVAGDGVKSEDGLWTFTFPVGLAPAWSGRVTRIALELTSLPGQRARLFAVTGVRQEVDAEALRRAAATSARVDLGGDLRSALLTPPDLPFRAAVEVPARAELRTAVALPRDLGAAVTFRAVVESRDGERVVAQATLPPPEPGEAAWHELRADLGGLAGQTLRLRLETTSEAPLDLRRGLPAWALPELVERRSGPAPPNVVLIVVDTLRADGLSLYGNLNRTSPRIDAWATERGVVFTSAIAPAPWTLPAHVSLFTGLDPLSHRLNYNEGAPASFELLAERLHRRGYATVAFTGGAYLSADFGLDQGFERFRARRDPLQRHLQVGKDLADSLPQALDYLASAPPEPFFLFFHTYEVHSPYAADAGLCDDLRPGARAPLRVMTASDPPAAESGWRFTSRFLARYPEDDEPVDLGDLELAHRYYECGVRRVDRGVGELLAALDERDLAGRTVVALTADHGESLGEHGVAGHFTLDDTVLRVPLVVAFPDGLGRGTRVERQVRLVDVAATLLEAAGADPAGLDGRSLRGLLEGRPSFPRAAESFAGSSNQGLSLRLDGRRKVVVQTSAWEPLHDRVTVFDLEADPGETRPLAPAASDLAVAAAMRRRFETTPPFLRARFANPGTEPFTVHLAGRLAGLFRVHGFGLPSRAVAFADGRVAAVVPPGADYTLLFDGSPSPLRIAAVAGAATTEAEASPERLAAGAGWSLAGGAWSDGRAGDAAQPGFELSWVGATDRSEVEARRELAETLRQLGYVR